jgi:hypothetical protein
MADLSLKSIANCMGHTGYVSTVAEVFGYVDSNYQPYTPRDLSLKKQLKLMKGKHLHINCILVGYDGVGDAGWPDSEFQVIAESIEKMREIFAKQNLGIGKVVFQLISNADAGAYETISGKSEAEGLTDDWNGPAGNLDVFWVDDVLDKDGWSAIEGPCDKDDKDQTGVVIQIGLGSFSALLAHEVGHYLGLEHTNATNNVMNPTVGSGNTNITNSQGADLRDHCYVRSGC